MKGNPTILLYQTVQLLSRPLSAKQFQFGTFWGYKTKICLTFVLQGDYHKGVVHILAAFKSRPSHLGYISGSQYTSQTGDQTRGVSSTQRKEKSYMLRRGSPGEASLIPHSRRCPLAKNTSAGIILEIGISWGKMKAGNFFSD